MVKTLRSRSAGLTAAALVAAAVSTASPAGADDGEYLRLLQARYAFLTPQQLLAEGHRVCGLIDQGVGSRDASAMVQRDLGVSPSAALDIVSTAVVEIGC